MSASSKTDLKTAAAAPPKPRRLQVVPVKKQLSDGKQQGGGAIAVPAGFHCACSSPCKPCSACGAQMCACGAAMTAHVEKGCPGEQKLIEKLGAEWLATGVRPPQMKCDKCHKWTFTHKCKACGGKGVCGSKACMDAHAHDADDGDVVFIPFFTLS